MAGRDVAAALERRRKAKEEGTYKGVSSDIESSDKVSEALRRRQEAKENGTYKSSDYVPKPFWDYQRQQTQENNNQIRNSGESTEQTYNYQGLTNERYQQYLENLQRNNSGDEARNWLKQQKSNLETLRDEKVKSLIGEMLPFHQNGENKMALKSYSNARKQLEDLGYSAEDMETLLDTYERELNAQKIQNMEANVDENTGSFLGNTKESAKSVGANLLSGFGYVEDSLKWLENRLTKEYNPLDTNSASHSYGQYRDKVRGNVLEDIEGDDPNTLNKALGMAYNAGMSLADFLAATGVSAGLTGGTGLAQGIMSLSAAEGTSRDVFDRTGSNGQAVLTGGISGAIEAATEKFSLDHFWDIAKGSGKAFTRSAVANLLAQAGIEGSEEIVAEVANTLTDKLINKEDSTYDFSVQNYMNQGMSKEEAGKHAIKDVVLQVLEAGATGALAGGMSGSVAVAGNKLGQYAAGYDATHSEYDMYNATEKAKQYDDERVQNALKNYQEKPNSYNAGELLYEMKAVDEIQANLAKKENKGKTPSQTIENQDKGQISRQQVISESNSNQITAQKQIQPVNTAEIKARMQQATTADQLVEAVREVEKNGTQEEIEEVRMYSEIRGAQMVTSGMTTNEELALANSRMSEEEAFEAGARNEEVSPELLSVNGRIAYSKGKEAYIQEQVQKSTITNTKEVIEAPAVDKSGKNITINGILSIEGEPTVKTSGGTLKLGEINFQSEAVSTLYNNASTMGSTKGASAYLKLYPGNMMVNAYDNMVQSILKDGELGLSVDKVLSRRKAAVHWIGEAGVKEIYALGKEKAESKKSQRTSVNRKGSGKAIDKTRSKTKEPLIKVFDEIAKKTGLDIEVSDKEMSNVRGYFEESMSRIVLNADKNMFETVMHELGEFTDTWNTEGMEAFQTALLDWYFETYDSDKMHNLISATQKAYKEQEGSKSYREAANEIVNDAISGLFETETGMQDFTNWLSENRTETESKNILQTIADFLKDLCNAIRTYISEHITSSTTRTTMEMAEEQAQKLREQFLKAMDEAIANYQNAEIKDENIKLRNSINETISKTNGFGLLRYTDHEIRNFSNGRTFFAETRQDIEEFIKNHVHRKPYSRILCGKIDSNLAERIKADTGIDISNYNVAITSEYENKHINPEKEAKQGMIAMHPNMVALLPDIIMNYDKVEYVGYNKQQQQVLRFEKDINGRKVAVEYVSKGRKTIDLQTMYGWENKKEKNSHQASHANAHDRTFKTNLDMSSSTDSISETEKNTTKRFSISGVNARTADSSLLLKAEHMLDAGADSETVRQETGWFQGYDGKMRFEIDDSESYLIEDPILQQHENDGDTYYTGKLSDILKHDKLYNAYPELQDMQVIIQETEPGVRGASFKDSIVLSRDLFQRYTKEYTEYLDGGRNAEIKKIEQSPEYKEYDKYYEDTEFQESDPVKWLEEEKKARDKFFSSELGKRYHQLKWGKYNGQKYELGWSKQAQEVLIHEIQHTIQDIEKFTKGSSEGYWQRRINEGHNIKTIEQRKRLRELEEEYDRIAENEKEFFDDMMQLEAMVPDVPRGKFDFESFEQIEEDPIEWQEFDKKRDELAEKYGDDKFMDFQDLKYELKSLREKSMSANDAYWRTAGEIEARDTANRLGLTEEERKEKRPNIDSQEVVLRDDNDIRYSLTDTTDLSDFWFDNYNLEGTIGNAASILEEGMKQLKRKEVDSVTVRKIARNMAKEYKSKIDVDVFASNLEKVFSYLQTQEKANYDDMIRIMTEVAMPVIEESTHVDEVQQETYKTFKKNLREMSIKLSNQQKDEVAHYYDSYENFRRKMFGTLPLSDKGISLDELWYEISEMSQGYLDSDVLEPEQPLALVEALEQMKPQMINNFGANNEEVAMDLSLRIYEEYFKEQHSAKVRSLEIKMRKERTEWERYQRQQYRDKLMVEKLKMKYKTGTINERVAQVKAAHAEGELKKKQRQEATEYRYKIKKTGSELVRWIEKPTNKKHVPEQLKGLVLEFLDCIDFVSHRAKDDSKTTVNWRERMLTIHEELQNASLAIIKNEDSGEQLRNFLATIHPEFMPRLKEFVKANKSVNKISEMEYRQLKELDFLMRTMKTAVTKANELHQNELFRFAADAGESTVQELGQKKQKRPYSKLREWTIKGLSMDMVEPKTFMERMGEGATSVYQELRQGFNKRVKLLRQAQQYTTKNLENISKEDLNKWIGDNAEVHTVETMDGKIRLSTGQIMGLYNLGKRNQGLNHILKGGVIATEVGKGSKRILQNLPVHVNQVQLAKIIDILSPEQKRLADTLQRFLATECAEWGNEVHMQMYEYKKFMDEKYWPIRTYSNQLRSKGNAPDEASAYAVKNLGFTNSTVEKAPQAIWAEDVMDTFVNHVTAMATYNAYLMPLTDAMKWFNYSNAGFEGEHHYFDGVRSAMKAVYGEDANRYFMDLLFEVNGETKTDPTSTISNKLASNFKKASVMGNLSVVIQQPTAYIRALNILDAKDLLGALNGLTSLRKNVNEALEYSAIAQWKAWGFYETYMGQSMKQIITGQQIKLEAVEEKLSMGAQKADEYTWGILWNACKREVGRKQPSLEKGSQKFFDAVTKRFDEVIDETQVVDTILHKSPILKSKGLISMEMAFMSELMKSYNMMYRAGDKLAREQDGLLAQAKKGALNKKFGRSVLAWTLSGMLVSMAASLIYAFRDDKDTPFGERYYEQLIDKVKDNLNPLNMIPFVKTAISMWQGYTSKRIDTEGAANVIYSIQGAMKKITNPEKSTKTWYGVAKQFAKGTSYLTGIPMYNVWRDTESLIEEFIGTDIREKETTGNLYQDIIQNETGSNTYENAYEKLEEKGKTEKDIRSGVRSKLNSMFKSGEITESEAESILEKWGYDDVSEILEAWKENK